MYLIKYFFFKYIFLSIVHIKTILNKLFKRHHLFKIMLYLSSLIVINKLLYCIVFDDLVINTSIEIKHYIYNKLRLNF